MSIKSRLKTIEDRVPRPAPVVKYLTKNSYLYNGVVYYEWNKIFQQMRCEGVNPDNAKLDLSGLTTEELREMAEERRAVSEANAKGEAAYEQMSKLRSRSS